MVRRKFTPFSVSLILGLALVSSSFAQENKGPSPELLALGCPKIVQMLKNTINKKVALLQENIKKDEVKEDFKLSRDRFLKLLANNGDTIHKYVEKNKDKKPFNFNEYSQGLKDRVPAFKDFTKPIKLFSSYPVSSLSDRSFQMIQIDSNDLFLGAPIDKQIPLNIGLVFDPLKNQLSYIFYSHNEKEDKALSTLEMLTPDHCLGTLTAEDKIAPVMAAKTLAELKQDFKIADKSSVLTEEDQRLLERNSNSALGDSERKIE